MTQPFSLPFVDDEHGCSRAAADLALPKAGTQRAAIYQAIVDYGPVSDAQLETICDYRPNIICARRNALLRDGLIVSAGTQVGSRGAKVTRWVVAR